VQVAVVIPALNEEQALPGVLARLLAALPCTAVVVDNGSTDATAAVATAGGAVVLREDRKGYGNACQAGVRWLAEQAPPPDVLVILDADGADDPGYLPGFVGRIERGEADFVLSTRTRGGAQPGALSPIQIWGNRLQVAWLRRRFALPITDMGPMRAIAFPALLDLGMVDPTWGWNVEMAARAARRGLRVVEVPVTYGNRRGGESKISGSVSGAARAGSKILLALWRYAR
jgi:glycosyltransferase involved in cell wall biosynthesis